MNKYLEVAELGNVYKEKGTDKTRVTVVNHILKVVSKDLKALNSMDKENPGMIDDAFEKSRAAKVELPESLTNRVGGQMSDRFPMKDSKSGKKDFSLPEHILPRNRNGKKFLIPLKSWDYQMTRWKS